MDFSLDDILLVTEDDREYPNGWKIEKDRKEKGLSGTEPPMHLIDSHFNRNVRTLYGVSFYLTSDMLVFSLIQ